MFSLCVQEGVLSGIKGMNLAGLRMPQLSSGALIQVPVLSSQAVSLAVAQGCALPTALSQLPPQEQWPPLLVPLDLVSPEGRQCLGIPRPAPGQDVCASCLKAGDGDNTSHGRHRCHGLTSRCFRSCMQTKLA